MQTIKNQGEKIVLLALVATALLSGCAPPGPRALLKGKELLDQGKFPQALEQLRTAASLLPTNAQAFNYLGLALHHAGQPADAEKAYLRALALNRDLAEVHYNLGCLWLSQNKLEPAKEELTAYTLRQPGVAEGWLRLGTAQLRSREPLAAERSFSEALRLAPQSVEALTDLGLARLQRNRPGEAAQYFTKALKEQPDYPPALLNLAIVTQEHLKDKQLALQRYQQYLALKPAPENSEAVQKVAHQLELELNPVPPPAAAPPDSLTQKNTNISAPKMAVAENAAPAPGLKPAATVQTSQSKTDLAAATARPRPATEAPKAATEAEPSGVRTQHAALSPPLSRTEGDKLQRKIVNTNEGLRPVGSPSSPKPQGTTEVAKARDPSPSSKPSPAAILDPAPILEVVTLSSEPVFRTAKDVPAAPGSSVPPPNDSLSTTATPNDGLAPSKPPKRSLLQKLNPARLFSGDENREAEAPPTSSNSTVVRADGLESGPQSELQSPPARYAYKSPAKPAAGQRSEAQHSFTQGVQAQNAQRLTDAIHFYRQATQLDPAYFDAYYNLGLAAMALKDLPLALATYETALAIQPESSNARYNFALALKQSNFPIDAANELLKLLALYPNESRAHLMLGNLYAQQLHQPLKAKQHYLKVLETDPGNPQAPAIRYWLTDNPL